MSGAEQDKRNRPQEASVGQSLLANIPTIGANLRAITTQAQGAVQSLTDTFESAISPLTESVGEAYWKAQHLKEQASDRIDRELPRLSKDDTILFKSYAQSDAQQSMSQLVDQLKAPGKLNLDAKTRFRLNSSIEQIQSANNSDFVDSNGLLTAAGIKELKGLLHKEIQQPNSSSSRILNPTLEPVKQLQQLPVQLKDHGVGPIVTRDYKINLPAGSDPNLVFKNLTSNFPNYIDPNLAHFYVTKNGPLAKNDLIPIQLHIDGPGQKELGLGMLTGVKVARLDNEKRSMTLRTLKYHPEAGDITFSVAKLPDGQVQVSIHSEARSSSASSLGAYKMFAKDMQTSTWNTFLKRIAADSGSPNLADNKIKMEYNES